MSRVKKKTRGEQLIGWLQMCRTDGTATETLSVYMKGRSVYLDRLFADGKTYRHLVHPGAHGWIVEAALVWDDVTVQGSSFRPVVLGYPENKNA